MISVAFCYVPEQEAIVGAYSCRTSAGSADHGLHQSWDNQQGVSSVGHRAGAGEDGHGQPSSARSAGVGGGVLRDCAGAVYAVVLPGSVALSAGGHPVAARSFGPCAGGRQVRDLAGPHAARLGAVAAVA